MIHRSAKNVRVLFDDKTSASSVHFTQEEVEKSLLENRERLNCLSHDIQSIINLFGEDCHILPMQCRESIIALEQTKQCVQIFHNLLDKPDRLPIIFSALRYRLIFQIHLIEKQTEQLVEFIESYRTICTYTTGLVQRRRQIHNALHALLEHISDLSKQTHFVKHEASFHQKRLASLSQSSRIQPLGEETTRNQQIPFLQTQQE